MPTVAPVLWSTTSLKTVSTTSPYPSWKRAKFQKVWLKIGPKPGTATTNPRKSSCQAAHSLYPWFLKTRLFKNKKQPKAFKGKSNVLTKRLSRKKQTKWFWHNWKSLPLTSSSRHSKRPLRINKWWSRRSWIATKAQRWQRVKRIAFCKTNRLLIGRNV